MRKEIEQIDFYCKKCKKSMKMAYVLTEDAEAPVLPRMTIVCHTNKCNNRVLILKKYTEGKIIEEMDREGKVYL